MYDFIWLIWPGRRPDRLLRVQYFLTNFCLPTDETQTWARQIKILMFTQTSGFLFWHDEYCEFLYRRMCVQYRYRIIRQEIQKFSLAEISKSGIRGEEHQFSAKWFTTVAHTDEHFPADLKWAQNCRLYFRRMTRVTETGWMLGWYRFIRASPL